MAILVGNGIESVAFGRGNGPAHVPASYLLAEDGGNLLLEDGSRIILGYDYGSSNPISSAAWGGGSDASGAVWTPGN